MPPPGYYGWNQPLGPFAETGQLSGTLGPGQRPAAGDAQTGEKPAAGIEDPDDTKGGTKGGKRAGKKDDKAGKKDGAVKTPAASETKEPGRSDAFWKAGKELTSQHKANVTQASLSSWQGALGLAATGVLGENLAKKVPVLPDQVLPYLPFLDDWSDWTRTQATALDQTQLLEQDVVAADGSSQHLSQADYLQIRDGKVSGKLNQNEAGLVQASGNLDFAQQNFGGSVTSTDGQTLSTQVDFDDQRFNAGYNGGQGKIQLGAGADLKRQQLNGSITSTDGQTLSARGDVNDGVIGLGYDGGQGKVAASAELNRETRSLGGQISSSNDAVTAGSSLSLADGVQTDSFVALKDFGDPQHPVEDKTRLKLGRRVGLGFDHTITNTPLPGQEKELDKGWNAGAYHDVRSGRNEISGGIKNSVQAGVATGGDEGTSVNLTLGQRVVGKDLQNVSAGVSVKPGEFQADLGLRNHHSHLKLNGSGVEADLSVPLGPGPKAASVGGGFKFSRAADVLSESLEEDETSCAVRRTISVSDDTLWGVKAKYVDPSGIAGKFSIETTVKQELSYTDAAERLAALPDIAGLETQSDKLEAEKQGLKHTEETEKKKLNELKAEHKKIEEKQEKPLLTKEARQKKLKALDQQIKAQETKLAQACTPQARDARSVRLEEIACELEELKQQIEPVEQARAAVVASLDARAASLLDPEKPEQSLAAAAALAPGETLGLQRERELGWEVESGVQTTATGSFGRTGKARVDLQLEGLGDAKVRIRISRQFERDLRLKGQAAGMADIERLGQKDDSRAYTLELDLKTPAGKAAYAALLGPINQLGRPLPELEAAPGVSLSDESETLRYARDLKRGINLGGQVTVRNEGRRDFVRHFDISAGTAEYTGKAGRNKQHDSKPLPLLGKLFGQESKITGANYELSSESPQSCTLSLKLSDETVRNGEASEYARLYQQSMAVGRVPEAPRSIVRTYNDGSSLDMKLDLELDAAALSAIVCASREQLVATARQIEDISGLEARVFAHQLEEAAAAALLDADQLGLQGEDRSLHLQAAQLRSVLQFIEHHGEAAVPFLQQLTGGGLEVCQASLVRGGYQAKAHLAPEHLAELAKKRQELGGEGEVGHKQVKAAEDMQEELSEALASLQVSLAALAKDPLIPAEQKTRSGQELKAHQLALKAELQALEQSGLLSPHSSFRAADLLSDDQLGAWKQRAAALNHPPDKAAERQLRQEVQDRQQQLEASIAALQTNRELPPAQRVRLIQALLDRCLELGELQRSMAVSG